MLFRSRSGHGTGGLAAFRAAGDGGYFLGVIVVVAVGALADGDRLATQRGIMLGCGIAHIACTLVALAAMRRDRAPSVS